MSRNFELKAVISAVDKLSPVLKRVRIASRATHKALRDIGGASRQLTGTIGGILRPLGGVVGALGVGGLGGTAAYVVKTSAQFEKFQTILETVEGSADKARQSMQWVQDFATKTPYELDQVTDAFVKLKGYGIDPQAGALKSAGDAAAALGKPLEEAVEALADAMTGQNERLKGFQIEASKAGNRITYTWLENGKTMAATANASSKAQIQAVLQGIWNRRYAGAMDKLSGTWDGMWSNVKDSVARFALAIGDAGLFPFLKDQMRGVLDTLNRMSADGSLQALALTISTELVAAFRELKSWVMSVNWGEVWADIKGIASGVKSVVESIGGLKGIAIGFGALLSVQILAPLVAIGGAVVRLGTALTAAGGGAGMLAARLKVLGGVGVAGAAGWGIGTWLNDNAINPAVQKLTDGKSRSLGSWIYDVTHRDELRQLNAPTPIKGSIDININGAPPGTRVSVGRTNQAGVSLNPDVGYDMLGGVMP